MFVSSINEFLEKKSLRHLKIHESYCRLVFGFEFQAAYFQQYSEKEINRWCIDLQGFRSVFKQ